MSNELTPQRTFQVLKSSETAVLCERETTWGAKINYVCYEVNGVLFDNYLLALREFSRLSNLPFNLNNIIS